jgi:FtsZ-binding cell division protein ZapB
MISLEQVQLLEAKVAKAIEYLKRLSAENASLVSEKASLHDKLEASQKRLDELEVLVMRFKEDQGRIEDGIIAALDRLNQFEEAFEYSLKDNPAGSSKETLNPEDSVSSTKKSVKKQPESLHESLKDNISNSNKREYFKIAKTDISAIVDDTLIDTSANDTSKDRELDIFMAFNG